MDTQRCVLEVLKWTPVRDLLLHTPIISSLWRNSSDSDELWVVLCELYDFETVRPQSSSSKAFFKSQLLTDCLYCVANGAIQTYSIRMARWYPIVPLSVDIPFNLLSSLVLVARSLIATGVQHPAAGQCASISLDTGTVTELPSMLDPRYRHSSLYYRSCVYVFGGTINERMVTKQAEKLAVYTDQCWARLPDIPVEVSFAGVCRNGASAYLCGGWLSQSCILFDLRSEVFTLLPFTTGQGYVSTAIVHNGRLMVFQHLKYINWSMDVTEAPTYTSMSDGIGANW